MNYKIIILDNNYWMYADMAQQIMSMLLSKGNTASLCPYEVGENTSECRYIFLGTLYKNYRIPPNSIVTNFDNLNLIGSSLLTDDIIKTCEIWDYSQENINTIKEKNPDSNCKLLELGYTSFLDYNVEHKEEDKIIDVLFLGNPSDRRSVILDQLKAK